MTYGKFLAYNVIGGLLWVAVCAFAGYFFGGHAFVKDHFSLVVLAIILISILPGVVEFVRHRRGARPAAAVVEVPAIPAVREERGE
jgi:membrane-associated protein